MFQLTTRIARTGDSVHRRAAKLAVRRSFTVQPMLRPEPDSAPGKCIVSRMRDRQDRRFQPTAGLASISTPNNSVNTNGVFGGEDTAQANWMISFLSPNQG